MKYLRYLPFVLMSTLPLLAGAVAPDATSDVVAGLAEFESDSQLFQSLSVWSTIIIALVTTAMVWIGGFRMRGGIFGRVFMYFALGMTLIFLGFIAEVPALTNMSSMVLQLVHSSLFVMGYVFMGYGANKLIHVVQGK